MPFTGDVTRRTERQVDALVEVVPGLAIPSQHVLGHLAGQDGAGLVQEDLVLVG
jgi:hypothetical protein